MRRKPHCTRRKRQKREPLKQRVLVHSEAAVRPPAEIGSPRHAAEASILSRRVDTVKQRQTRLVRDLLDATSDLVTAENKLYHHTPSRFPYCAMTDENGEQTLELSETIDQAEARLGDSDGAIYTTQHNPAIIRDAVQKVCLPVDDILDRAGETLESEIGGGEDAHSIFTEVSPEAKTELRLLLLGWMQRHVSSPAWLPNDPPIRYKRGVRQPPPVTKESKKR